MFDSKIQIDWLSFTYRPNDAVSLSREITRRNNPGVPDDVLEGLVDWDVPLSINTLFDYEFPELRDLLLSSETCKCRTHYDCVVKCSDGILMSWCQNENYEVNERLGFYVQVPSHGLESFFKCFGLNIDDVDFRSFIELIHSRNCRVTRLDLAWDDYSKKYSPRWYMLMHENKVDPETLEEIPNSNHMRTRMMRFDWVGGSTLYIGNRKKGKFMRIYDKSKESNGANDCIRYEFELHSEYAEAFLEYYLYGSLDGEPVEDFKGFSFGDYFVSNWFEIINRDSVNSVHCSINEEWFKFIYGIYTEPSGGASSSSSVNSQFNAKIPRCLFKVKHYSSEELLRRRELWVLSLRKSISLISAYRGKDFFINNFNGGYSYNDFIDLKNHESFNSFEDIFDYLDVYEKL